MNDYTESHGARLGGRTRMALWGGAACLLLLPLVAMQFTREVAWTPVDFVTFGAMLASVCGGLELAARVTMNRTCRAATGLALVTAFLLTWVNVAVGIIGSERDPANLAFGVLLGGLPGIKLPALGLIAAIVALTLIASKADGHFNLKESLMLAAVLSIGSYLAFVLLLKLQFTVWPTFISG